MISHQIKYSKKTLIDLYNTTDNPNILFQKLNKINHQAGRNNKLIIRYINKLNKEYEIDFYLLAKYAIKEGINWFEISSILTIASEKQIINTKSLIDFLVEFYKINPGIFLNDIFINIVKKHPKKSFEILDKIILLEGEFITEYIVFFHANLFKRFPQKVWRNNDSLLKKIKKPIKNAVIRTFGNLDYSLPRDRKKIGIALYELNKIEKKSNVFNSSLVFAYGGLLKFNKELSKKILQFSKVVDVQIKLSVIVELYKLFDHHHRDEWYKKSLYNVAEDLSSGVHTYLGFIINNYMDKQEFEDLIIDLLIHIRIHNYSVKANHINLKNNFNTLLYNLINNKLLFQKFFTKVLNHDNYVVHSYIQELSRELHLINTPFMELSKEILDNCNFEDLLYICRKVLGYIIDSQLPLYLVLSILKKDNIDDKIKGLVFDVIRNHIGKDYSSTTISTLKQLLTENMLNDDQKNISKNIISSLEEYHNKLNGLPSLKELRIPKAKQYRIRLTQSRSMSKSISKETKESSILMQLAQNVPLKYGVAWFSHNNGNYSESSPLNPISHTVELPKTEITDPVGSSYQRGMFRLARRGGN